MRFTGSPTIVGTLCALLASQNLVHAKLGASLAHPQEEPTLQLRENFVSARALQELVSYGGKPDPERLPLGLCEGDCDEDEDVSTAPSIELDISSEMNIPLESIHRLHIFIMNPPVLIFPTLLILNHVAQKIQFYHLCSTPVRHGTRLFSARCRGNPRTGMLWDGSCP